ncbi:MAG TPA: 3-keto-5-aminohexanoate cleavage protein [Candidatus Sumerlaeota bacterium]|nr:MAG: 3-keto-5-aminohexanoate cleavage enzyme [candidate division BRC1 bacterium ADurb.BinA292]HOE97058.1 3-keto-5-aminohexanoate cleavage protein [Candidatus Sumerlaeota bacterium]HOR27667.1 3-keto-5-aminohexanoate cleavage protein [Candidatus Sumerlaeota bacterium]HPK01518.1 3-keto-5-aminohexanoate cleavage protein [Candidatus Sumerlaeota bacterium]
MGGFILNFTPNGMVPTREMTPHVPLTPEEIVRDVDDCVRLGANMVHLHARDAEGRPTYDKEIYARIIGGVRERHPELLICVSTSGRLHNEFWQRAQVLELEGDVKPDFASLTLSSLNFARAASINEPAMIQDLARRMLARGIRPELECFDLGMVNVAQYLIDKQLVPEPYYVNLIVGNLAGAQADLISVGALRAALPAGAYWSVGGIGHSQLVANTLGLAAGGGVRVGLEDNLWLNEGRTTLASNAALVERVVRIGGLLGREPYSPAEVRALLTNP